MSRSLDVLRAGGPDRALPGRIGAAVGRAPKSTPAAQPVPAPVAAKRLGIGREAKAEEIAGWDIDIRPDGQGLPPGKGTVKQGEPLYMERCAACHGEFGESAGRWPILMGGAGTLASNDPVKSIGSYWPYASTVIDYIRRSMPFGNAQSLTNDELYAITAYVLYLNDVIKDENFELNEKNFTSIKLPNQPNFIDDDREVTEKEFWRKTPCMANCAPGRSQDHRPRPRARRDAGDRQRGRRSSSRHADARGDRRCSNCVRCGAGAQPSARGEGDKALGEYLSSECVTCHQITGRYEGIPPIVGWPEHDLHRDHGRIPREETRQSDHADDRGSAVGRGNRRACRVFRKPAACQLSITTKRK